ncbi:uncharacterized protein A4U43_C10F9390 [Asparagus officinalis]|uniref:Histone deacetylation protein Rxt3 n=1 Tax=Asparagus officinalis TaxID=4686 RepID=A0A5P1E235_ASPOF|nr:DNA ligase 1 [Asparagus officinalis]ONK56499.1 uncharacterized protein A4U43_C10F9390 [Asparagus officinalis]
MSTPKRLHEEGSHSSPLKRPLEEAGAFSGVPGKVLAPVGNDFHLPYEPGQDGRTTKFQRIEPRDIDKRSSLMHRMSSSPSSLDQLITSESRSDLRNPKDARDVKTESREPRSDARELYSEARMDPPVSKPENEVRADNRGDEKEFRTERGSHNDFKGDAKFERDSYATASSHMTWKELKEHQRGKRYFESSIDNLDPWRASRHGLQNTVEVANSRAEEWDSSEAHEAVGENKIDMKSEEKFREKDRKRKEERQRDFGESYKDRNDRRSNMQVGEASSDRKEETERWERERKDAQRDKEHIEKDKDSSKRELPSAPEKDWHHSKEMLDGAVKISEQEVTTLEPRRLKDDNWKVSDKDVKDRKKERDVDMGDKHEQCGKSYDKELYDASGEGEGVTEREREAFGNGIQQRRRMLRTRGTPQTPNREPRFRSKARENEGSQGKPEVSTVVYKAGECMQELLKSWKEFEASQEGKIGEACQNYPTLEIRIPAEYITSSNRQVRGAQLWGTDIYTNDSDLFAVLMHTGYCRPTSSPPDAILELRATVRVLPPQEHYSSTLRNNVRSRAWGAGIGCSFRVEQCCIVKKGGGTIDLEPRLTHISALEPTLAPVSAERTMTTRSAASNALRQQRFVREVSIQYNLCNEPWLKYSISIVADKGLKKPHYTSARLKKGEVLYLETHSKRYELCYNGEKVISSGAAGTSAHALESEQEKRQHHNSHLQNGDRNHAEREHAVDMFRFSRCKKILPAEIMLSSGIPMRVEDLEVIEDNVEWEDLQWSQTGVLVAGKTYALARVHFLASKKK